MQQRNAVLVNGNALRLGLFGANCASGRTYATLAERWEASWETVPVTVLVAYAIVGLELIATSIEDPFGYDGDDLPLDALVETIRSAAGTAAHGCEPRDRGPVTPEQQ